ncbi:MAG TPA: type I-E CRISPR-associated protein Cas5/CasD [Actinobacteria bacterium]|nr:type I-E CRISPR-associated protein Cas5/CasD [Actinomycetota bacterium]
MTSTLTFRIDAPLQSWGLSGRFSHKDTAREPTKSGIVGLIANAMGRDRSDPIGDLASVAVSVRVESEPRTVDDYRTVGSGNADALLRLHGHDPDDGYFAPAAGERGARKKTPIVIHAHHLIDGAYLVALHGEPELLHRIATALDAPRRPVYLGRRGFFPVAPFEPAIVPHSAAATLRSTPWRPPAWWPEDRDPPAKLRLVEPAEPHEATAIRYDEPVSFAPRRFAPRFVKLTWIERP